MPNKVRMVVELDGRRQAGARAKASLLHYAEKLLSLQPKPTSFEDWPWWKRAMWLFDALPVARKALWIFREPRRVAAKNSRYMYMARRHKLNASIARRARGSNSLYSFSPRSSSSAPRTVGRSITMQTQPVAPSQVADYTLAAILQEGRQAERQFYANTTVTEVPRDSEFETPGETNGRQQPPPSDTDSRFNWVFDPGDDQSANTPDQ